MKTYSYDDLNKKFEAMTVACHIEAVTTTRIVGGLPASEEGLRAFIKYQMGLTGDEADEALRSIVTHEFGKPLGTKQYITLPTGAGSKTITTEPEEQENTPVLELAEVQTSSVNLIRRDEYGSYLGDWMLKANLKAAASRVGLFVAVKGVKGDMAEMGRVRATGTSAVDLPGSYNLNRIYLRDAKGKPVKTEMDYLRGRVNTPSGPNSIITLAETCPPGAHVSFEFRFFDGAKVSDDDIADIFAAAMNIGWGSAKSWECGKFRIEKLTVDRATNGRKKSSKVVKITEPEKVLAAS